MRRVNRKEFIASLGGMKDFVDLIQDARDGRREKHDAFGNVFAMLAHPGVAVQWDSVSVGWCVDMDGETGVVSHWGDLDPMRTSSGNYAMQHATHVRGGVWALAPFGRFPAGDAAASSWLLYHDDLLDVMWRDAAKYGGRKYDRK